MTKVIEQDPTLIEERIEKPAPMWRNVYDYHVRMNWVDVGPMGPGPTLGLDVFATRDIAETHGREFADMTNARLLPVIGRKVLTWIDAIPVEEWPQ